MPELMFGGLKGFFRNKNEAFKPNLTFASFNFLRWHNLDICIMLICICITL